jgi:hypothetical protein
MGVGVLVEVSIGVGVGGMGVGVGASLRVDVGVDGTGVGGTDVGVSGMSVAVGDVLLRVGMGAGTLVGFEVGLVCVGVEPTVDGGMSRAESTTAVGMDGSMISISTAQNNRIMMTSNTTSIPTIHFTNVCLFLDHNSYPVHTNETTTRRTATIPATHF